MARIRYVDTTDLPADERDLLAPLSEPDADDAARVPSPDETLNVFRAIGRNAALLEGFRTYADVVWTQSGLSPTERELVVLTTAYAADAAYEWHHHVRVALDVGLDPEQILAISREEPERLGAANAALVAYVTQFVAGSVDDETHARLTAHYDEAVLPGIGLLAGCYLGLARFLDALAVDLETEFVGWELERL